MQAIVLDKPYEFVPPDRGKFWPSLVGSIVPRYLSRAFGVERVRFRGVEKIRESLKRGDGILIAPNHSRPSDPPLMILLGREIGTPVYTMASAHLFTQSAFQRWLLPRVGAFSVYREGMDRAAVNMAVEILEQAERPLVLFPEGIVTRTNSRLGHLQEGTALIARTAAKKRSKREPAGCVVVHPVAIRYFFHGDLDAAVDDVMTVIESRLSWQPQRHLPLTARIVKAGDALLNLKELEYFGQSQAGTIPERLARLINRILEPLEQEWVDGNHDGSIVARVKRLRGEILPEIIANEIDETERTRRWRHLADIYLVQQLSLYPPDYIAARPTPERILETVERFEEDLTDAVRVHRPFEAVVEVSEAIEVNDARGKKGEPDPLMRKIEESLTQMLEAMESNRDARD